MKTFVGACLLGALMILAAILLSGCSNRSLPPGSYPASWGVSDEPQEAIEGPTVHIGGRGADFIIKVWYFRDDNQGLCFAVADSPTAYRVESVSCDRMRW
jgi:hypothetical protein